MACCSRGWRPRTMPGLRRPKAFPKAPEFNRRFRGWRRCAGSSRRLPALETPKPGTITEGHQGARTGPGCLGWPLFVGWAEQEITEATEISPLVFPA